MQICLITSILSPHQMPFAQSLVNRLGEGAFRYIATEQVDDDRKALGWGQECNLAWVLEPYSCIDARNESGRWMGEADLIISGNRDFNYFEQRAGSKQLTFYMSERWFKPPFRMLRLLHPQYLRMAFRFYRLLYSPSFYYLPIGSHAANDMVHMVKLFSLLPRCVSRRPPLTTRLLQSKILLWGYFVAPSTHTQIHSRTKEPLNVLWVGRMLGWKRVDSLIMAVGILLPKGCNIRLTVIGQGLEEGKLKRLAEAINNRQIAICKGATNEPPAITFRDPVPIDQVRDLMRQADVYVLPSDGGEGWGAVANEAMEEGCVVIATRECGSGATIIKDGENGLLFDAGDVIGLAKCLRRLYDDRALCLELATNGKETMRTLWNPDVASERLLLMCESLLLGLGVPSFSDGPMKIIPHKIGSTSET